jgi:hypothetical protein
LSRLQEIARRTARHVILAIDEEVVEWKTFDGRRDGFAFKIAEKWILAGMRTAAGITPKRRKRKEPTT